MEKKKKISCQYPAIRETTINRNKIILFERKYTHKLFINKLNYSLLVKVIYIANYSRQEVFNVISTFSTSMLLYLHIPNDFCA